MKTKIVILILLLSSFFGYSQVTTSSDISWEMTDEKDVMEGIQIYSNVINSEPNNIPHLIQAYCNRGDAKRSDKNTNPDYKGAIQDYTKAIELAPNSTWAYYHRGLSKLELDMKKSGCRDLRKAVELGYNDFGHVEEECN